jgi:hypothetical protein
MISEGLKPHLNPDLAKLLSEQLLRGVEGGSEINDFHDWLQNRFLPQLIWLDKDDYTRAITRALPQALKMTASDFGSSRQRDLGQLWTDTARGFMGEIAVKKFLEEKFDTVVEPDISTDKTIDKYIATDIKSVSKILGNSLDSRPPKQKISIKTGKFNARWLDEYSAKKTQNIDAFIFVRVGSGRDHFIAFLKTISFLGTKLFPEAERLGELNAETKNSLWDSIPSFQGIPAYISGFLLRKKLSLPIHSIKAKLSGKKSKKIAILEGVGEFSLIALRQNPQIVSIDPKGELKIVIDGLDREIDNNPHFFANTGSLEWGVNSWHSLINSL